MKNNIDKDIEIVKEIITHKDDYDVCFGYRIAKPYSVSAEEIQAISNVVSELSNLKWKNKIYAKSIKSHKELIENKDKELEIWKKIAEFMADFINMYTLSGEENQYCHRVIDCQEIGSSRSCIECIIDWAKREVLKDE